MRQRNELFTNRVFLRLWQLNRQRHLFAIRSSFIAMMPLFIIGAYAIIINNLPIRSYQQFMENTFGSSWTLFGDLVFNATLQIITLMLVFAICSNLTRWYNENRGTKIHANLTGMIGITAYLVAVMPLRDLTAISFSNVDVSGFFMAILISIVVTEIYVRLVRVKKIDRIINDSPDAIVPLAFSSIGPAIIIIGLFILLRIVLVSFGIYDGLTDIFNQFLQNLFAVESKTPAVAILYTLTTQVLWFFGIHGHNVLESVVENTFQQVTISGTDITLSKTFFDAFILMGGSGAILGLFIALLLFSRSKTDRTLFRYALPNAIFNISEPLVFGIPIVLNPIYAIPFIVTPLVLFFTTYGAMKFGLVLPIIHEVAWTTPIFISGYYATESFSAVWLQLFNLIVATLIYVPFVLAARSFTQLRYSLAFKDLVSLVTVNYSPKENLLMRIDGLGAVSRQLVNDLEKAMTNGDLTLHYQPIVDVKTNQVHSVEALLRWNHSVHGRVHPMLVIALAEEAHMIDKLGLWIVKEAIKQRRKWTDQGLRDFKVGVNVSTKQLQNREFCAKVLEILEKYDVEKNLLQFEVTESIALVEDEATVTNLKQLDEAGIDIAMDDFGVGHSSLLYLRSMPIKIIKIDSSLSTDVLNRGTSFNIIATIFELGQLMDKKLVVEHVDNEKQLETLLEIGDFLIQGYLFSPPIPADDVVTFVKEYESRHSVSS